MTSLKMVVAGGVTSGKRTFIESHFLHKPLIATVGSYIYTAITTGSFTIKYANNDYCHAIINNRYIDRLDSDKQSKIYEPLKLTDRNELILPLNKFNELYLKIEDSYIEYPLFDELTIYINDPFLQIFEVTVATPRSTMDIDLDTTINICNSADIVLYIMNVHRLCAMDELEFLSQIQTSNLMVVVNKMDIARENEITEIKKFVSYRLQPLGISNIQYVSSLDEYKLLKY